MEGSAHAGHLSRTWRSVRRASPRHLRRPKSGPAHLSQLGGGQNRFERLLQFMLSRRIDIQSAFTQQARKRASLGGDHGTAAGRCFDGGKPKSLHQRRQHQHSRKIQQIYQIIVGQMPGKNHPVREAKLLNPILNCLESAVKNSFRILQPNQNHVPESGFSRARQRGRRGKICGPNPPT